MTIRRHVVPVVTEYGGDAEIYSPRISGKLVSIRYVKPGSGNFEDGVDFALTSEATGATLWAEDDVNASATRHPRAPTHTVAGVAALYAASGAVNTKIALGNDRVKIVVTDGGDETTGTFHITVDD